MARIPLPSPDEMSPEQRRVYDTIVTGPRGRLVGPLRAALHRPELAEKWQQFGELLRYRTSLPPTLSELAILVTAWHCQSSLEWHIHEQIAVGANLPRAVIESIKAGIDQTTDHPDIGLVYDYARELNEHCKVSEPVYKRALERLRRQRHRGTHGPDRLLHDGCDDLERSRNSAARRRHAAIHLISHRGR